MTNSTGMSSESGSHGVLSGFASSMSWSMPSAIRARPNTAWTSIEVSSAEVIVAIHFREITIVAAPALVQLEGVRISRRGRAVA